MHTIVMKVVKNILSKQMSFPGLVTFRTRKLNVMVQRRQIVAATLCPDPMDLRARGSLPGLLEMADFM